MKKTLTIVILLAIIAGLMARVPFEKGRYYDNIIHASFTMESVGNIEGKIDFIHSDNGTIVTPFDSFNELAEEYKFIDFRQIYTPKDKEWNDNGQYLQCIYEIKLSDADAETMQKALVALNGDENINYAQYEVIMRERYTPNDTGYNFQYYIPITHTDEAWEFGRGSEDIVIGIADSGIYWNHPDLQDNIYINQAENTAGVVIDWVNGEVSGGDGIDNDQNGKVDDVIGWNFAMNNNNPHQDFPGNEHGTHVAGCASAVGDNGIGVAGPGFSVKIACASGRPDNESGDGVAYGYEMLQYFADLGCDIGNASWGGLQPNDYWWNEARQAIQYCVAQGMLVVAAAGNSNEEHNAEYRDAPSDIPEVLCVAATNSSDSKADFSDYGVPIDICAPGAGIYSTYYGSDWYTSLNGTSMASPIVAGIAGLIKSVHPNLTPQQLRDRIETTEDDIYPLNTSYADVPNQQFLLGTGRVNALAATYYDVLPNVIVETITIDEVTGDGDGVPNPGETIEMTIQLNNMMYIGTMTPTFYTWATAYDVNATLSSPIAGVSISNESSDFGIIAGGSSISNYNDRYVISTVLDLSPDNIPLDLTITANLDTEWPYTMTRRINLDLSLVHANWPVNIGGSSASSPLILDLDNDGTNEVVFTRPEGSIDAYYADGTQYGDGAFPVSLGGTISGSLAISDLDGNGTLEMVACRQNGEIHCIDSNGAQFFPPYTESVTIRANPSIADLDGNGTKEIIAVSQGREIIVLNSDGSLFVDPILIEGATLAPNAVGDLNNDGTKEIVITTTTSMLHVINPTTGAELPGFPVNYASYTLAGPTLAQLDTDANLEILVPSTTTGVLHAYDDDGSVIFERTLDGQIKSSVTVGEVNDMLGVIQIVAITTEGTVYVMDPQGNDIPNFPTALGVTVESTPILAGLDDQSYATIIFGDSDGFLHGINYTGQEGPNFPMSFGSDIKVSPAVGDLDGDGNMDIVFCDQYAVYDLDLKYGMGNDNHIVYRGDKERTGASGYLIVGNDDNETTPIVGTALYNAYPNPFNPETTFAFDLKTKGDVMLDVFNIKGQKVTTLVNRAMNSGNHSVIWKGTDKNGDSVPSGIYFYRLTTDNFTETKKAVLMK
ncbi:MAG: S8 family serine peptidase [Candidatus Zophobacter franzmannii]|nr:S8 family serine peptidase [Candidatus Zophobacter franzmannii]